jgi:hypothetical protein
MGRFSIRLPPDTSLARGREPNKCQAQVTAAAPVSLPLAQCSSYSRDFCIALIHMGLASIAARSPSSKQAPLCHL